ncbi:MAG: hypothetical protein R3E13_11720 [Alphaproteobacteria bacterium]
MENIPQEAWVVLSGLGGAFVGGLITLIVTLIQNVSEGSRLTKQLEHDRGMRAEDREMSLRRDIYYGAIESVAAAINTLSSISEADIPSFSNNSNYDFTAKFYKVQLIAGKKVLERFYECSNLINNALFSVMPHKLNLQNLEIEHASNEELRKISTEAHKDITAKMEEFNREGQHNEELWASLTEASDEYMKEVQERIPRGTEISKEIALQKLEITKQIVPLLTEITKAAGAVIFAMREELDSKADDKIFTLLEELIEKSNNKNQKLLNDFLEDIDRLIEEVDEED